MSTDAVTMAEVLSRAGYRTAHIGKWHLGYSPATMPNRQGFDHSWGFMSGCIDNYSHFFFWEGVPRHDLWRNGVETWASGEHLSGLMDSELQGVIDDPDDRPFFLYWAPNQPHYPLQPSQLWLNYFNHLEAPRRQYAASLAEFDAILGNLLAKLKKLGKLDNTVLILQSDHGHSVEQRAWGGGGSSGPYRGHKATLLEGGLRVPSMMSFPRSQIPKGSKVEQAVSALDWFPTIMGFAGISTEEMDIDGKNLMPHLDSKVGATEVIHQTMYWQLGEASAEAAPWAVREGVWKLMGGPETLESSSKASSQSGPYTNLRLFNLDSDLGEARNVVGEYPEVVERLLAHRAAYQRRLSTPHR
jgi:arylsulfatase A